MNALRGSDAFELGVLEGLGSLEAVLTRIADALQVQAAVRAAEHRATRRVASNVVTGKGSGLSYEALCAEVKAIVGDAMHAVSVDAWGDGEKPRYRVWLTPDDIGKMGYISQTPDGNDVEWTDPYALIDAVRARVEAAKRKAADTEPPPALVEPMLQAPAEAPPVARRVTAECLAMSPDGLLACTLPPAHEGCHEYHDRSGRLLYAWPNIQPAPAIDEQAEPAPEQS